MATTNGRAEILRAARITFARHGFDGASIRDIAQEAGLSLSALYYYFPSKQDALHELIHNAFTWFSERARATVDAAGSDPIDRLTVLVRFTVRYRSMYRQISRVILRDTERLNPEASGRSANSRRSPATSSPTSSKRAGPPASSQSRALRPRRARSCRSSTRSPCGSPRTAT